MDGDGDPDPALAMDGDGDPDPALAMGGDGDPYYARHGDRASYLRAQANHGMVQDREEEARRLAHERLLRRGRRHKPRSPPSSSRQSGPAEPAGDGTTTRVRQSLLYSDRPRRSRGRRGRASSPNKLPVEKHVDQVSSSELGSTSTDLSKFEALALNVTPPTLESTVRSDNLSSVTPDSTIVGPSVAEEALPPRSEIQQKLLEVIHTRKFDSVMDAILCMFDVEMAFQAKNEEAKAEVASMVAPEQARSVPANGHHSGASREDIARNGKKWMSEEVMVAFEKYIERTDDLKGLEYQFDELLYQCFNVEHYYKIFHHFNFTVKMKAAGSVDWTTVMYFAEVLEILREKTYICYPLGPDENGHCYACKNQGMDELRHPEVGAFDRGNPDTEFPYYCADSDSDEECRNGSTESEDELYTPGLTCY